MHQLSDSPAKALPPALPARGLTRLPRTPLAAQALQAATSKFVFRASDGACIERVAPAVTEAAECPPNQLPLQLRPANRPANRLGNLHRLQDLLTEFLHAPDVDR